VRYADIKTLLLLLLLCQTFMLTLRYGGWSSYWKVTRTGVFFSGSSSITLE
jgi:hypothetical protein